MSAKDALAVLGVLALVTALAGAGMAVADLGPGAQGSGGSTIVVSASGEAKATPDEAVIRLEVGATDANATVARTRVAENVSDLRDALSELGVGENRIRTVDFNLNRDEPHRPREKGTDETVYRVSHELVVEVDDVNRTGAVIDAAIDEGATNVHDVRFTLSESNREELRNEALDAAMSNARAKAEILAENAELEIAGVHVVSTGGPDRPVRPFEYAVAAAGGDGGTQVDSGPVTVSATVSVRYNATG